MRIGMLGDIIFEVSDNVVRTINNAQWSGSARYPVHQRHGTNALTEFAGINPDQFSFDIILSAYLGVNPQAEITKIWQYERTGRTLPLVIGRKGYGKYRWTITQHQIKLQHYDSEGDLTQATVTVSLQEYLNR